MTASALAQLLDPDPDEGARKYQALLRRLTKFFDWRGCPDAEDLAAETLVRGLKNVAGGTVVVADRPDAYFFGIARNVLREAWRHQGRQPDPLSNELARTDAGVAAVETRIMLDQTLSHLPPAERRLMARYYDDDERPLLCDELGLSPGALRIKVYRLRRQIFDGMDRGRDASMRRR